MILFIYPVIIFLNVFESYPVIIFLNVFESYSVIIFLYVFESYLSLFSYMYLNHIQLYYNVLSFQYLEDKLYAGPP